jgi:hypothetical protein
MRFFLQNTWSMINFFYKGRGFLTRIIKLSAADGNLSAYLLLSREMGEMTLHYRQCSKVGCNILDADTLNFGTVLMV